MNRIEQTIMFQRDCTRLGIIDCIITVIIFSYQFRQVHSANFNGFCVGPWSNSSIIGDIELNNIRVDLFIRRWKSNNALTLSCKAMLETGQIYFKNYVVFTPKDFESMFAISKPSAWKGKLKPGNCCSIAYTFLSNFSKSNLWSFVTPT